MPGGRLNISCFSPTFSLVPCRNIMDKQSSECAFNTDLLAQTDTQRGITDSSFVPTVRHKQNFLPKLAISVPVSKPKTFITHDGEAALLLFSDPLARSSPQAVVARYSPTLGWAVRPVSIKTWNKCSVMVVAEVLSTQKVIFQIDRVRSRSSLCLPRATFPSRTCHMASSPSRTM